MRSRFLFLMLLAVSLYAEDIYVSDAASGSGSGVDASNTHSMAWFNNATNWGSGADKVSPGDTVHLVGTIATTWTVAGSGTAGSIITVIFEPGAKFSKPYWSTMPNSAIYANGKSYITVDGNNVGLIENTANGTALANQQLSHGIGWEGGGTDVTFKRLTISLYARTPNSSDTTGSTGTGIRGITTEGISNLTIDGCALNNCKLGMNLDMEGASGFLTIKNNASDRCSTNYQAATTTTNFTGVVSIHGNSVTNHYYWDAPFELFHSDGIHLFTGTGKFSSVDIYQNNFFANFGAQATSPVFLEGSYGTIRIWSNLIGSLDSKFEATIDLGSTASPGTPTNLYLVGNTVIGKAPNNTGNAAVYLNDLEASGGNWGVIYSRNNIFYNFYSVWAVPDNQTKSAFDLDYDGYWEVQNVATLYTPPSSNQTSSKWDVATFQSWLGDTDETNAKTANPLFVGSGSYALQTSSTYKDAGTTLASPYNITLLGNTRISGSFDFGAYEFGETNGADTTPPTPSTSTISSATVTGTTTVTVVASTATDASSPPVQYAVSTDNGSTWSSWQSSATFNITGLTAATTYQCKVKARDSATTPNETTPSSATAVTTNSTTNSRTNPKARPLTVGF